MDVKGVNKELEHWATGKAELLSFTRDSILKIAFSTISGGEKESEYFVVTFTDVVVVKIPSILPSEANFDIAPWTEAHEYIPPSNYDKNEFGEEGFRIFRFVDLQNNYLGYFVAAGSMDGRWVSCNEIDS